MNRVIVFMSALMVATSVLSSDVGVFRPTEDRYSYSVVFEKYKRDVIQDIPEYYGGGELDGEQDENHIFLRLTANLSPVLGFKFDVGAADSDGSEGYVPMLGAGAHYIVFANETVSASVFGQVHYVSETEYKGEYDEYLFTYRYVDIYGHVWSTRKESYFEYDAGVELAKDFFMVSGGRCSLYGGAMLSFLMSDGEEEAILRGSDNPTSILLETFQEDGVDFEADLPIAIFAGIDLAVPSERFGVRIEGRFLKQSSLSLAAYGTF